MAIITIVVVDANGLKVGGEGGKFGQVGVHVGDKIEHLDVTESLLDLLEVVVGRKNIEVGLGDNRQKHLASDSRERVGSLRRLVNGGKPAALGSVRRDDVADALGECGLDLVEDRLGRRAEAVKALSVGEVEYVVDDVGEGVIGR